MPSGQTCHHWAKASVVLGQARRWPNFEPVGRLCKRRDTTGNQAATTTLVHPGCSMYSLLSRLYKPTVAVFHYVAEVDHRLIKWLTIRRRVLGNVSTRLMIRNVNFFKK